MNPENEITNLFNHDSDASYEFNVLAVHGTIDDDITIASGVDSINLLI